MKRLSTMRYYSSLLCISLEENGFETEIDSDGYIRAYSGKENGDNLLILPVCRRLSNVVKDETTMIRASGNAVRKLVSRAADLADDFIPCIGYGIGKYSYSESEVCIAPVSVWSSVPGSVFSIKSDRYYYNYLKAGTGRPAGAILRATSDLRMLQ